MILVDAAVAACSFIHADKNELDEAGVLLDLNAVGIFDDENKFAFSLESGVPDAVVAKAAHA